MDSETVETVTEWAAEPFEGGYAGLHDLASREFTGAVTDGAAWAFLLNGRVVGVADGDVGSFADADGTAYAAPDPSLPLLFAMREEGGETKAQYYTNDTPLSEVDATLSAGNFTGYVALSENVLSGDYYVVYHGGRSLACAFVGNSRRTLTGDEAFARALEEVGIYEVCEVNVSVVDVPEPEPEPDPDPEPGSNAAGATGDAGDAAAGTAAGVALGDEAEGSGAVDTADTADADVASDPDPNEVGDAGADDTPGGVTIDPGRADDEPDPTPDEETTADPSPQATPGRRDPAGATADADEGVADGVDATGATDEDGTDEDDPTDDGDDGRGGRERRSYARQDGDPTDAVSGSAGDPFSAEEQWRETRSIPSLDPNAGSAQVGSAANRPGVGATVDADRPDTDAPDAEEAGGTNGSERAAERDAPGAVDDESAAADADAAPADLERAREARDEARAELEEAREELDAAWTEAGAHEAEVSRLREENERLRDRVRKLETELDAAREEAASARERAPDVPADRAMSADRALDGTNLFVRYASKGGATLADARSADAARDEVNGNLRLEWHTDFEAEGVVVDGRPFGEFLTDTVEYGFVEWAVRDLIYEIRETFNESALRNLFTALPSVDRAELHGTVDLLDEDRKRAGERTFDVVLRDRMGTPIVVADVTDSREPTSEETLDELVESASAVAEQEDELGGAFSVSASFFEPGALEAAADATGGGLLGRGKHKSFVRLSRKRGFHLCLVESREGEFHVTVPEL